MQDYLSLNHTKRDCKYHVVCIPKPSRKQIYRAMRKHLGDVFQELAPQKQDHEKASVVEQFGIVTAHFTCPPLSEIGLKCGFKDL